MTWQPIETAPKDGTAILVYGKGRNTYAPYMGVREWYGEWLDPNINGHDLNDDLTHIVTSSLSHWMPLPEPPPLAPPNNLNTTP